MGRLLPLWRSIVEQRWQGRSQFPWLNRNVPFIRISEVSCVLEFNVFERTGAKMCAGVEQRLRWAMRSCKKRRGGRGNGLAGQKPGGGSAEATASNACRGRWFAMAKENAAGSIRCVAAGGRMRIYFGFIEQAAAEREGSGRSAECNGAAGAEHSVHGDGDGRVFVHGAGGEYEFCAAGETVSV